MSAWRNDRRTLLDGVKVKCKADCDSWQAFMRSAYSVQGSIPCRAHPFVAVNRASRESATPRIVSGLEHAATFLT